MNKCNVLSARFPADKFLGRIARCVLTSQVRVLEVVILKTLIFTMVFKVLESSSSKNHKKNHHHR